MASSKGGAASPAVLRASEMEKMSVEQLKALKEQIDLEVNLLQDSLNNIKTATGRLETTATSLHDLSLRPQGKPFISFLLEASISLDLCLFYRSKIESLRFVFVGFISNILGKKMLVPLTASLYVPGTLDDADKVLVDIGTGYFVEKTMNEGKDYCERKINLLKSNFEQLIELATKKKTVSDEAGAILQAKLRQLAPTN
uniref:Prefoldin subunit 5 n=1 Tax=Salix viminalis TaxID=40686 RepID=A0A6N2M0H6_SALVM